jgi:glycosyltransferase involved in cell wall biosynthesis
MKNILFFTQNRWAFGTIHHALIKELYKHGFYCNLLDWTIPYTEEEFSLLSEKYDIFVTMPDAVMALHDRYKIPFEKIITIAHGQWDILLAKSQARLDFYPLLKGFGVISNILKKKCEEWEISRVPNIVELGIHFDHFYSKPSTELKIIGYGGSNETKNFFGQEIKRPSLVPKIVENIEGLELYKHKFYHHLCMPSYYKKVDCVIMSSIEEAGGLPMMECAAAGRLPIGTPVGYFKENAPKGGGILVPVEEQGFLEETKNILEFYKNNSGLYFKKCLEIQDYARENYDWSKKIDQWISLFVL